MLEDMTVIMDRDRIDIDLFRDIESLPQIVMHLNTCEPFSFLQGDRVIAQCLVRKDDRYEGLYDIVDYVSDTDEILFQALSHILDYYSRHEGRYVEIGCGNARIDQYALFQRLGFRVIGVLADYYLADNKPAAVENAIVNRDMVRFRADLHEKKLATTGYDASGRT